MKIFIPEDKPSTTKAGRGLPRLSHATPQTRCQEVSHATEETAPNPVSQATAEMQNLHKPFYTLTEPRLLHATEETASNPVSQLSHATVETVPEPVSQLSHATAETVPNPVSQLSHATVPEMQKLPADVRAEAAERLKFIRLVNRIKTADAKMTIPDACTRAAVNHADEFPILIQAGHGGRSQLTYSNYRNWTARLRDYRAGAKRDLTASEELEAVASSYARGHRDPSGDPEFWQDFCTCYLSQNRPDIPEARRLAVMALKRRDPSAVPPTMGQVRYFVKHLPVDIVIRGREGEVAWESTSDYITRDWSNLAPGECLIGDSRTFDTRVCWQDEDGEWKKERPTVVMLLDARTWYPASWIITVKPVNHEIIMRCLAQFCVSNGGMPPAMCYFDNGSDYCKTGFSTPLEIGGAKHSVFSELGIGLVNSIPYRARAKTVERMFRDMMKTFDKWFPDYLGSHPEERPDAAGYFDRPEHLRELPTLETFTKLFTLWTKDYITREKEGKIHGGKSPEMLWNELPHHTGRVFSDVELAYAFLLPAATRKVGRGPSVEFNRRHYFCDAVRYGETVLVKVNLWDPDMILLCREDGTAISIARTREAVWAIAGDDEHQRELLDERMARQARLRRESQAMLQELTGGRYGISMIEFMLTMGTDARFVVRGQISTVKGKSHVYKRIAPAQDAFAETTEPEHEREQEAEATPADVYDFSAADQDEPAPPEMSEIEEYLAAASEAKNKEEKIDLTDIYTFVHTKKPKQGDPNYDNDDNW